MPRSKKPRHPHRRKSGRNFARLRPIDLEWLQSQMATIELKVETALPRGLCTDTDMYLFRDYINWGVTAAAVRTWYTEETRQDVCDRLNEAAIKVCELQIRGRKNGCRYVCTAEELRCIREAFDFLGDFMRQSLHECPAQTIREWAAMITYSQKATVGHPVQVDINQLIQTVKRS